MGDRALRHSERNLRKEANWEARHGMYGAAAVHQAQAQAVRQERMAHHHHAPHHHVPHHAPHHHVPHHAPHHHHHHHHETAPLVVGPPPPHARVVVGRPGHGRVVVRGCCTIL